MSRFQQALSDVNGLSCDEATIRVHVRTLRHTTDKLEEIADSIRATSDGINRREVLSEETA